jgi:hypothetical protein
VGAARAQAADVRERLSDTASQFLAQEDLRISISARVYLSWLIRKAAMTIAEEGKANDSEALLLAEARLRELISAAASGATASSKAPLQQSS